MRVSSITTAIHRSLYGAIAKGAEAEAAARHLIQAAAMLQKKATIKQYNERVLAVHHLPHDADRVYLIADCGLLNLVDSGKAFTSESPEILGLMGNVLAKAGQWSQHFSLNFTVNQAPISFFITLMKKTLKREIYRSRPGTVDRQQYHYQVMTVELIDEQLALAGLEPPVGLAIKHGSVVVDDNADELLAMRDRVLVRGLLLDAAVARYSGITPKFLLDEDSINGSVDVGIPVLGTIAAGGLIDSYFDEQKERLDVPSFYQGSDHFAVQVTDHSMIEDLIREGDVVIMRPVKDFDDVKDGTVVAARVLGQGISIKYYQIQIEGSKVILRPSGTQYRLTFNPEQVNLQGAVVGVWRCFDGGR